MRFICVVACHDNMIIFFRQEDAEIFYGLFRDYSAGLDGQPVFVINVVRHQFGSASVAGISLVASEQEAGGNTKMEKAHCWRQVATRFPEVEQCRSSQLLPRSPILPRSPRRTFSTCTVWSCTAPLSYLLPRRAMREERERGCTAIGDILCEMIFT